MSHFGHACNQKRIRFNFFFALLILMKPFVTFAIPPADTQESHPGISRESRYAEAVIAFNKRKTEEAIKILDELLKEAPKTIEYLELKALALKGTGDEQTSLDLYRQLFEAKPENERGPYAFEIAMIYNKQKNFKEAKPYFEKSIELNFNSSASHLFLGLGLFNESRFAEAEPHFNSVIGSGIIELEVIAQYYVSICYFKLYLSTRGVQELVEARDLALKLIKKDETNANGKNIFEASEKMLQPFSTGQWFGNASMSTQYDSNIQQLPTGVSNTVAASNTSTIKENILAGLGYMSAPANLIQAVIGYRGSFNKNFNQDTKNFEYFTNNASLFLNYRSLAKTNFGIKVESNFVFQNALIDPTNTSSGYEFQKFNLTVGGGAYIRHQWSRYWRTDAEVNYRTQKYYTSMDQSGKNINASINTRRIAGDRYWNPGFSFIYEQNQANGADFYYKAFGLGFLNSMNFPALLTFTQGLDLLASDYLNSTAGRKDTNVSLRFGALKFITPKISVMADLNYIKNISTLSSSYTYHRLMTSLGIGFML